MNALITVSGESTGLTRWTQQTDGGNGSHAVSKLHLSKDCHLPFLNILYSLFVAPFCSGLALK